MANWDSEQYWDKSGRSFNLDDDRPSPKYNMNDISKFSVRKHAQPHATSVSTVKTTPTMTNVGGPVSIAVESDLETSSLLCSVCNKLITQEDSIKFEGKLIFTNDTCWKHWIRKMVESCDNLQINNLWSHASKRYLLECVCSTYNGQKIIKVILLLKSSMGEFEFGSLLYENNIAYNHYMSFLRETRQTDEKLMRCRNMTDEVMKNLREIVNDNRDVTSETVRQFIRKLTEFREEIQLNSSNMDFQLDLIGEYINLLELQASKFLNFLNQPLIATVIETKFSYQSIMNSSNTKFLKDNFKMTPEEFFWTSIKPIVYTGKIQEIEKAMNYKGFGSKPDILYERIVSFLYSINKEPDELKMKCLLKISDVENLINCANSFGLLAKFNEYCKQNKETSVLKRIHNYGK